MTASESSYFPICGICNKPVKLETSKIDELGKAVHEGCYLLKTEFAPGHHAAASPQSLTRSEAISYFRNQLQRKPPDIISLAIRFGRDASCRIGDRPPEPFRA